MTSIQISSKTSVAIAQLSAFGDCLKVRNLVTDRYGTNVETDWSVTLPNRFKSAAISDTGVRSVECVHWRFPHSYPLAPPVPTLRVDFPTDLPHINPHTVGKRVFPCIAEMSLNQLLHSQGFQSLLVATSHWLNHAAANELHCPAQGWEPMRRDEINGVVFTDSKALRSVAETKSDTVIFHKYRFRKFGSNGSTLIGYLDTPGIGSKNNSIKQKDIGVGKASNASHSMAIVFYTDRSVPCDTYRSETINNYGELVHYAEHLNVKDAVIARMKAAMSVAGQDVSGNNGLVPVDEILIVFAIKRPFNLVGANTTFELIAYRIDLTSSKGNKILDSSKVTPVQLSEKCSPHLLQAVSGDVDVQKKSLAMLGCGSLGSKMALHLAKTGCYTFKLLDNEYFSSHNNARHGLIVNGLNKYCTSKAQLLNDEIAQLGVTACFDKVNATTLDSDEIASIDVKYEYIVDTTASLQITYFLSHQAELKNARLVQSSLYGAATMGVLTIEGKNRSVRADDFTSFLDSLCLKNEDVRKAMYRAISPQHHQFGEGCGSMTTIMSDIDISVQASPLSSKLHKHILESNDVEDGIVHVGCLESDTMNFNWEKHVLSPTLVIPRDEEFNWDIRILGQVSTNIKTKTKQDPNVENGGLLAGHYCTLSNTIYITDELAPPTEPKKTSTRIDIITESAPEMFQSIHEKTNGQITFIGTWHSHTTPTPPSPLDKQTLKKLQSSYDFPVVMLVQIDDNLELVKC